MTVSIKVTHHLMAPKIALSAAPDTDNHALLLRLAEAETGIGVVWWTGSNYSSWTELKELPLGTSYQQ